MVIALSVTFGTSSPRGAFVNRSKLILAEQSILYTAKCRASAWASGDLPLWQGASKCLYRKCQASLTGGRHCDTSFIFVVDVMKQKEAIKSYKMLEPARKLAVR